MGDIVYKMCSKMPETFFRFNVFLPADMAITALNNGPAVETILFFSFGEMRHLLTFG